MSVPVIRDAFFISLIIILFSVMCGIFTFNPVLGQTKEGRHLNEPESLRETKLYNFLKTDLRNKNNHDSKDDSAYVNSKKKFVMTKSPWTAVGLSALLPGLGQFYNESYWKIPIIAAIEVYFTYEIVRNNDKFLDYRDKYAESQSSSNPSGDPLLKTYREFYRDQRDSFIIYFGILYLVNLFDAYVDAHLYDFDVSDEMKIGVLKNGKILKFEYYF